MRSLAERWKKLSQMLAEALSLAQKGWWVLPLIGKLPLTPHGFYDASCSPEDVVRWWTRLPNANIGALVPPMLLVVDIDPRNGGEDSLARLESSFGCLPPTLTVLTGRGDGGRHLYYWRPPKAIGSARRGVGIDVKTSGYCVVPPSRHPESGDHYRWADASIAALPSNWVAPPLPRSRVLPGGTHQFTGSGDRLIQFVAKQHPGNRNNALYWASLRAAEGHQLAELQEPLVRAACATGLSELEARRVVTNVARQSLSEPA